MIIPKIYDYEDWWEGNICLIYSYIKNKPEDEEFLSARVSWDAFIETEIPQIKETQKILFDIKVNAKLKEWKDTFLNRYKNSQIKDVFLTEEIKQYYDIMFAEIPLSGIIFAKNSEIPFEYNDLIEIQQYVHRVITKGIEPVYDFMHSPNYLFQDSYKTQPEIYAQCCWEYCKWLEKFEELLKTKKSNNDTSLISDKNNKEPLNSYPHKIFKNEYAYQMFLRLKELTIRKGTELAGYSFIYHKMHNKTLKAINEHITQPAFIKFLNTKYYTKIKGTKFRFTNPASKQEVYNFVLKEYIDNIITDHEGDDIIPKNT